MFRIPEDLKQEMTFEEAKATLMRLTTEGGLLEGLQVMRACWDEYQETYDTADCPFYDDDHFYDHWQYEVNAFNVVYEKMAPLFA